MDTKETTTTTTPPAETKQAELPGITPEAEELKRKIASFEAEKAKLDAELEKYRAAEGETKKALQKKAQDEQNYAELIRLKDEELTKSQASLSEAQKALAERDALKSYITTSTDEAWKVLTKEDKEEVEKIPGYDKDDPMKKMAAIKFYNDMKAKMTPPGKPNPFHKGTPEGQTGLLKTAIDKGDKRSAFKLAVSEAISGVYGKN